MPLRFIVSPRFPFPFPLLPPCAEDEGEDEGRLDQQMGDVGNEGDVVDEKKPEEDSKEEAKVRMAPAWPDG